MQEVEWRWNAGGRRNKGGEGRTSSRQIFPPEGWLFSSPSKNSSSIPSTPIPPLTHLAKILSSKWNCEMRWMDGQGRGVSVGRFGNRNEKQEPKNAMTLLEMKLRREEGEGEERIAVLER